MKVGRCQKRIELRNLLDDMDIYAARLEGLLRSMKEKRREIPYIDKLLAIKGIGMATVSGFTTEVEEIGRFDSLKQMQKLAGYGIVANGSGKHNEESWISYRRRKCLRYVPYEAAMSLLGKKAEFREPHRYYQKCRENPLKKLQSVVACKAFRVFMQSLRRVLIMLMGN